MAYKTRHSKDHVNNTLRHLASYLERIWRTLGSNLIIKLNVLTLALQLTAGCAGEVASPERVKEPSPSEQVFDQLVPVIEMEQLPASRTGLQGYRIRIFRDGRVEYAGLKDVRQLGLVNTSITPSQVTEIELEFRRLKYWRIPLNQFGDPPGFGVLARTFTLRDGTTSKTVRFGLNSHGKVLQETIEKIVNSARFRCPFVGDRAIDVCPSQDASDSDYFYKQTYPKLVEEYK